MTDQPTSLDDYQHVLGRELVAAAHRQGQSARNPRLRFSNPLILVPAVVVLAVALLGVASLRPQQAAGEVFVVTKLENEVRLDVVDIITDPAEVEAQLAEELGLEAELLAIPAWPSLEGKIIVTANTGDVEVEVAFDDDNAINQIILPKGFDGGIIIEYGRQAEPGEDYEATTTAPVCAELWGKTPSQIEDQIAELAVEIRYDTIDADLGGGIDVPIEEIDPTYRLVDIIYLNPDEAIVFYAANLNAIPKHPNCG